MKNNLMLFPILKLSEFLGLRFKHITRNIISDNFFHDNYIGIKTEIVDKNADILFISDTI